jgi:hypothetical protein
MHVFMKPPDDDKHIKTCHGESNTRINTVILLILLALFPDPHALTVYTQQKVKVKLSLCLTN